MHNPFTLYTPLLLNGMLKAGHRYFVRQTYKRGMDHFDEIKNTAFLISPYPDESRAMMHYDALKNDGNRFLYSVLNTDHLEKLNIAVTQPAGYKIYAPLLPGPWKPSDIMAGKIRRYIDHVLHWHLSRKEGVRSNLFIQFGELFITLRSGKHEIKIPLSDIERL